MDTYTVVFVELSLQLKIPWKHLIFQNGFWKAQSSAPSSQTLILWRMRWTSTRSYGWSWWSGCSWSSSPSSTATSVSSASSPAISCLTEAWWIQKDSWLMEDVLTRSAIIGTWGQGNMSIVILLEYLFTGSLPGPKDWTCPSSVPPACKARATAPPPPPCSCLR